MVNTKLSLSLIIPFKYTTWPIGFSKKLWVATGYDNGLWILYKKEEKTEEKEMKKDSQYKLNKAMALALAYYD